MNFKTNISIIIPNFNREDLLPETLDSLLEQSYQNWEAIIVDDGSTDDSLEIALKYQRKDKRFKVTKREVSPKGASMCRNLGLERANGDYVIFLDSDDKLAPFCLESRYSTIQNFKDQDFLVFQIASFSDSSDNLECYWNIESSEPDLDRFLKLDAVWQTSSVLWKIDFLKTLGGFDPSLACWQDVDIHLRALLTKNINYKKFLNMAPDMFYRRHIMNSISQQNLRSLEKLKSRKIIIQKIYKLLINQNIELTKLQHMATNVILSAAGSVHTKIAFSILWYSYSKKIISTRDILSLLKVILVNRSKLTFLPAIKSNILKTSNRYLTENMVCKIPLQ